jgi:hypothetical protein
MDSFWNYSRGEARPTSIDTKTKVPQQSRPRKMDIDDYFAMDSLLACSDLEDEEEEEFLKTQSKRKHRVIKSLEDKIKFCTTSTNFTDSYKELNTTTSNPDSDEGNTLLSGNIDFFDSDDGDHDGVLVDDTNNGGGKVKEHINSSFFPLSTAKSSSEGRDEVHQHDSCVMEKKSLSFKLKSCQDNLLLPSHIRNSVYLLG